jgi:nitroreductase
MDAYEAIRARHTVRDFDGSPIDRRALERILEAGVAAPSNDHMKEWDFVLVEDRALRAQMLGGIAKERGRDEVAALLEGWARDGAQRAMYFDAVPRQYRMLFDAPTLLVPVFAQPSDLLKPRDLSSLNAFASIWCCIENILVAAASEGIMGVTRIPSEEERPLIRRILRVPEGRDFPCCMALGYPAPGAAIHLVSERPIGSRLRANAW